MKAQLSIKLDPLVARHARRNPNVSRYVENLIKQDMQLKHTEPIYDAVTTRMLKDLQFLSDLRNKLSGAPGLHTGPALGNEPVIVHDYQ